MEKTPCREWSVGLGGGGGGGRFQRGMLTCVTVQGTNDLSQGGLEICCSDTATGHHCFAKFACHPIYRYRVIAQC